MRTEARLEATPQTLSARRSIDDDDGSRGRVVFVHGFAQNAECVGPLSEVLSDGHELVMVDAPGHGGSSMHAEADLWTGADLLSSTGEQATYVGYSMGARLCLHVALAHPGAVQRLVLISGTAGIENERERGERAAWDEQHAVRLEEIGVDAFVAEWLATPLFATLPRWARFDEERGMNTVDGLAGSLRHAGTGSMEPLWDRLSTIECPVLVLSGESDERYRALGTRLAEGIGANARHRVVAGAGHAAHLEQPSATAAAITEFLAG